MYSITNNDYHTLDLCMMKYNMLNLRCSLVSNRTASPDSILEVSRNYSTFKSIYHVTKLFSHFIRIFVENNITFQYDLVVG